MLTVLQNTFLLLIAYQVKHFIADFPLQREYMLKKTLPNWDFLLPLVTHCLVHALGTLILCLWLVPGLWWLAIVDFVVHFIIDRVKSGPRYLGRYNNPARSSFWVVLGLDQMAHHITHIYFVFIIIQHMHKDLLNLPL
jgi:hypothetical protein